MSAAMPVGRLRRVGRALRLLAAPGVPGAGEVRRASGFELERRVGDRLEEPAVVRDEDHRRVEVGELLLEPLQGGDVEVVRRLVEEQQVGVAAERPRERGARQLAAGERPQRTVEVLVAEAEAAQDGRLVVAPAVAPGVLEPALRFGVAPQRRRRRAGPRPSPARAAAAPSRARRGRTHRRGRTRAASCSRSSGGRWSCRATRVPFWNASSPPWSSVSPASMRRSVVLPAPFGPASATRSRRSTLNETPSKSTRPPSSLRRLDAITTAMRGSVERVGRIPA